MSEQRVELTGENALTVEEMQLAEFKLRESGEWKTRRHSPGYCSKGTQGYDIGLREVQIANKLRVALTEQKGKR